MKQVDFKHDDIDIPIYLQSTQEWFASIITNSLDPNSSIQSFAPNGMCLAEEAGRYIVPSRNLKPHQRMQIYNQQYWWRLLKAMHENFPLLTRLYGYQGFNEIIAIPYLLKYPPNHWSLSSLGERLLQWIEEEYQAPDIRLVQDSAQLDLAFTESFLAPENPPINLHLLMKDNPDNLLTATFHLQPHIFLFQWDYHLMTFREAFLEHDVDYWVDNPFPKLEKERKYYFVLYRTLKNLICWKELSQGEYLLLKTLKEGATLEAACEYLEEQETAIYKQAVEHLQGWLHEWVSRHWLTGA